METVSFSTVLPVLDMDTSQENSRIHFSSKDDYDHKMIAVISETNSPNTKRKSPNNFSKRSKSAPPGPKELPKSKDTFNVGKLRKNVYWNVEFPSPHTVPKKTTPLSGSNFKVAVAGAKKDLLLESIIAEAYLKSQRQSKFMRLFTESSLSQSSYWRKLKWYNASGHVFSMLHIAREWVKNEPRTLWCKENGVNMAFMNFLWGQCKSIYGSLLSYLKHENKIPATLESLAFSDKDEGAVDNALKDILIEVFGTKVCAYRGVKSAGYYCFSKKCHFDVDFIPAVNFVGSLPEYIIPLVITKCGLIKQFISIPSSTARDLITDGNNKEGDVANSKMLEAVVLDVTSLEFQARLIEAIKSSMSETHYPEFDIHTDMHFTRTENAIQAFVPKSVKEEFIKLAQKTIDDIRHTLQQELISITKVRPMRSGKRQEIILNLCPGLACKKISSEQRDDVYEFNPFHEEIPDHTLLKPMEGLGQSACMRPMVQHGRYMKGFITCIPDEVGSISQNYKVFLNKCTKPPKWCNFVQDEKLAFVFQPPVTCKMDVSHDQTNGSFTSEIEKILSDSFGRNFHDKVMFHQEERAGCQSSGITFVFKGRGAGDCIKKLSSKTLLGMKVAFVNKEEISMQLSTVVLVSDINVFEAVNSATMKAIAGMHPMKSMVKHMSNPHKIYVKFVTENPKLSNNLLSELERCVSYTSHQNYYLSRKKEYLQSDEGRAYLNYVMCKTGTAIVFHQKSQKYHLYGPLYGRNMACDLLDNVDENSKWVICSMVSDEFTSKVISDMNQKGKILDKNAIKEVAYDYINQDLICHLCGPKGEIDEALACLPMKAPKETTQCVVCFESTKADECYMLQCCGHCCCHSCLCQQMDTAVKNNQFPIRCAQCDLPFSILDVINLDGLNGKIHTENLLTASLRHFINSSPNDYMVCPNTTCDSVLVIDSGIVQTKGERSVVQCKFCKMTLCFNCKSHDHPGISCEENMQDIVGWIKGDPVNRRRCPSCSMGIQKNGGCHNVWCTYCKKAICWKCNEIFETEDLCYRHMRSEHGGYN